MGLQDGKMAPGWWNGYNNQVYLNNNFQYDTTKKAVIEEIFHTVKSYTEDIGATISFFVKKIASEWNNPTFQTLWMMSEREGKSGLDWLIYGNGKIIYTVVVNILQSWILIGSFLFAILRKKNGTWEETLLVITFIRGFIFHLFWEAKEIYTLPFLVLLIPLSIVGYNEYGEKLLVCGLLEKTSKKRKESSRKIAVFVLCIMIIFIVSYIDIFRKLCARNDDEGIYNPYLQNIVNQEEDYKK
ncbi:MAG: hypothetical protein KH128_01965 [Firmicutes bacterium]|nr:hypothetical protein [Bacillota bacterium]